MRAHYPTPINAEVAGHMAALAAALKAVGDLKVEHGTYYVSEVRIGFDGEDTGFRIIPDDFDGFNLVVATPQQHERRGASQ